MSPISVSEVPGAVRALVALPRAHQPEACRALAERLPAADEAWNTAFGSESLFDCWTSTALAQGVYRANRAQLQLEPGWRALEIGGGDGRLWRGLDLPEGTLTVVDPSPEVHQRMRRELPRHVELVPVTARIEEVDQLPPCDRIVCSLTLHHLAGHDAEQRRHHGLEGPGKLEVLTALRGALTAGGFLLVNEADVHCDLELAPGDRVLADRLVDSYVRRTAVWLVGELERDPVRAPRLAAIVRHWCLEQVALYDVPVAERDVYELDVPRWRRLFDEAGFTLQRGEYTDDAGLFWQYILR